MSGDQLTQATAAELTAGVPPWAAAFKLRPESDGRLFLVGELDGCNVYVQPKAWSKMTLRAASVSPEAGALNYGLNLPQIQAHAGSLQTNDPAFGQTLLGSAECRVPAAPAKAADYTIPGAILLASLVLAGVLAHFRRS